MSATVAGKPPATPASYTTTTDSTERGGVRGLPSMRITPFDAIGPDRGVLRMPHMRATTIDARIASSGVLCRFPRARVHGGAATPSLQVPAVKALPGGRGRLTPRCSRTDRVQRRAPEDGVPLSPGAGSWGARRRSWSPEHAYYDIRRDRAGPWRTTHAPHACYDKRRADRVEWRVMQVPEGPGPRWGSHTLSPGARRSTDRRPGWMAGTRPRPRGMDAARNGPMDVERSETQKIRSPAGPGRRPRARSRPGGRASRSARAGSARSDRTAPADAP